MTTTQRTTTRATTTKATTQKPTTTQILTTTTTAAPVPEDKPESAEIPEVVVIEETPEEIEVALENKPEGEESVALAEEDTKVDCSGRMFVPHKRCDMVMRTNL